jgi:hypothetical protein
MLWYQYRQVPGHRDTMLVADSMCRMLEEPLDGASLMWMSSSILHMAIPHS